jgi:hypothetical protein
MNEFMKVVNHGAKPIDLRHIGSTAKEARLVELHFNTNGSIEEKPSLAIVMQLPSGLNIYGQMSLETLNDCLEQLGYEIRE